MGSCSLPNLVIAGVNKAATTSLFMYLSAHPDICPSTKKETGHFLYLRYGLEMPPIEHYQRYFDHCQNEKYVMEATGGYFYGGAVVAKAMKKVLGRVKVILLLREPIARLFSFYKFKKSMLELDQDLTFEEYVRRCENLAPDERRKRENNVYWGIEGGFYADYLEDWFDAFGSDDLKVLFSEHLRDDPESVLIDLCGWLGIEHDEYISSLDISFENKTMDYKSRALQRIALAINWEAEAFWRSHPRIKKLLRRLYYAMNGRSHTEVISEEMKAYLGSVFKPYNQRLAVQLLGHGYTDLPAWLSQEIESDVPSAR